MSDLVKVWLVISVFVTVIGALVAIFWHLNDSFDDSGTIAKWSARVAIFSPLWPLMLVVFVALAVRSLWCIGRMPGSKKVYPYE